MSKIFLFIYLGVLQLISCARPKELVNAEISPLAFDSLGYNSSNVFIYQVGKFDSSNREMARDSLGLFILDFATEKCNWDKLIEWQYVHSESPGKYDFSYDRMNNSTTGITIKDTLFMLHPPRFGGFADLQFCPYPCFRKLDTLGKTWNWDFVVGSAWATTLYPIVRQDTIRFMYKFEGIEKTSSAFGPLSCRVVSSEARSSFGISTAKYFINAQWGIVKMDIMNVDKSRLQFDLIAKDKESELMIDNSPKEQYRKKQKLSIDFKNITSF